MVGCLVITTYFGFIAYGVYCGLTEDDDTMELWKLFEHKKKRRK